MSLSLWDKEANSGPSVVFFFLMLLVDAARCVFAIDDDENR